MNSHKELTDSEFLKQFEDCLLDPALFNHEAHLRLAWILINKVGVEMACERVFAGIKAFDIKFDEGKKYHKTLTYAAVLILHHFMNKEDFSSFEEVVSAFPDLITNFKKILEQHYDLTDLSDSSRFTFQEPILPFTS